MTEKPKIWGLGVGPGDPDLITLKALKILQAADIVAYPAPTDGDSFARAIAAPHLSGAQQEYPIRIPMIPESFPPSDVYDAAARDIGGFADGGKSVVVLCEGDPFFYGSFMYLFQRLVGKWPVGVVPGVSSMTACAAVAGMPLGSRNDVISILPATLPADDLRDRIARADAAVLMKVGRNLAKVRTVLDDLGLLGGAIYVERATLAEQRMLPLADVADDRAPYFSMILVRKSGVGR